MRFECVILLNSGTRNEFHTYLSIFIRQKYRPHWVFSIGSTVGFSWMLPIKKINHRVTSEAQIRQAESESPTGNPSIPPITQWDIQHHGLQIIAAQNSTLLKHHTDRPTSYGSCSPPESIRSSSFISYIIWFAPSTPGNNSCANLANPPRGERKNGLFIFDCC